VALDTPHLSLSVKSPGALSLPEVGGAWRARDLLVMNQMIVTVRGRGEADYRGLLIQEASGQSLRSLARARGISAWTLYYGWSPGSASEAWTESGVASVPDLAAVDVVGGGLRPAGDRGGDLSLERLVTMVQALRSS